MLFYFLQWIKLLVLNKWIICKFTLQFGQRKERKDKENDPYNYINPKLLSINHY